MRVSWRLGAVCLVPIALLEGSSVSIVKIKLISFVPHVLAERELGVSTVLLVSCYSAVALPGARYAAHAQYTVSTCEQAQRSNSSLIDKGDKVV